jgi:tetratricopeptide (TPR) repeat protein
MAAPEGAIQQALCPILVGRAGEMRILDAGLAAARRHVGGAYVLAGEAGIGKTKLAAEVRGRAAKSGMLTLWGACSQAELALPYLPMVQALGGYLATTDLAEVSLRLGSLANDLGRILPQLHSASSTDTEGDPVDRKLRLFESVVALLSLAATPRGGLLVIEDVQWADTATREVVDYLVRRVAGTSVMVLITCRSDELHRRHPLQPLLQEWRRGAEISIVDIRALAPVEVAAMVRSIFQAETVRDEFRDLLFARSSGNPFVIEEMLKDAIDRGDIFRTATGWDRKPISELSLPRRVRDAILSRFEELPSLHREVLRTAAVLGRPCDFDVLAKFVGESDREVEAALADCVQHQLLDVDGNATGRYSFRHALTREAIYGDLVLPERRQLHARLAGILANQPDSDPLEICHHLFEAGEWAAAIPLALEAAERAAIASAHSDAAALYERVLDHVTEPVRRAEIVWLFCQRLNDLSEWARSARYLEAEIPLLEQAGEMAGAARLRLSLARASYHLGRPNLARLEVERAREGLEAQGPSGDLAEAYRLLAAFDLVEFRCRDGIAAGRRAVEVATQVGDRERLIEAWHYLGCNLVDAGEAEEGFSHLDRAIEEALDDRYFGLAADVISNQVEFLLWHFQFSKASARLDLWNRTIPESTRPRGFLRSQGLVSWRRGALPAAIASYREAARGYRERGATKQVAELEFWLAVALADMGSFEECRKTLELTSLLTKEHRVRQAWARMRMGLDSGDLAGALGEATVMDEAIEWPEPERRWLAEIAVEVFIAVGETDQAREVVRMIGPKPGDPYQMRMEGRLAMVAGDDQLARERLIAAADFWRQVGGRLEEARSRRLVGQVISRLGNHAAATEQLRLAYRAAVRCGASTEAQRAKEELARLGAITEVTPEQVKHFLEVLHQPAALGESELFATISLSMDIDATQLRDLLGTKIGELCNGPIGEEAEAGKVLRDCYVNRVGSHEAVAERLHLSRRTFYRRLDRGLLTLAERLSHVALPATI